MDIQIMGELFAFSAALLFTSQAILIRRGMTKENSGSTWEILFIILLINAVLFFLGLGVAALMGLNLRQEFGSLTVTTVLLLMLEGGLGPLAGVFLQASAIARIGVSRTAALFGCNPVYVTIFAVTLLGERLNLIELTAVIVLTCGVILVSYRSEIESAGITLVPKTMIAGSAFALMAGLCAALSSIARGAALQRGATPNTAMSVSITTAMLAIIIICRLKAGSFNFLKSLNRKSLYCYASSGVASLAGRYVYYIAFTMIPVWRAVAIRNTQPLLAILFALAFFAKLEVLNARVVVGSILITLAIWTLVFGNFLLS